MAQRARPPCLFDLASLRLDLSSLIVLSYCYMRSSSRTSLSLIKLSATVFSIIASLYCSFYSVTIVSSSSMALINDCERFSAFCLMRSPYSLTLVTLQELISSVSRAVLSLIRFRD
jgi:hypothetical protein